MALCGCPGARKRGAQPNSHTGVTVTQNYDRTCKRCSVGRVNALVKAYHPAHTQGNQAVLRRLRQLNDICGERGFSNGSNLLIAGLKDKNLRSLCWNVSSFLEDDEFNRVLGL